MAINLSQRSVGLYVCRADSTLRQHTSTYSRGVHVPDQSPSLCRFNSRPSDGHSGEMRWPPRSFGSGACVVLMGSTERVLDDHRTPSSTSCAVVLCARSLGIIHCDPCLSCSSRHPFITPSTSPQSPPTADLTRRPSYTPSSHRQPLTPAVTLRRSGARGI